MTTTTGIELTVNGRAVRATVEPRTSLADFLREQQGLPGTHVSCEQGVCGACTVLLDGRPVRACITWAAACEGADVRTIEGFDDDPLPAVALRPGGGVAPGRVVADQRPDDVGARLDRLLDRPVEAVGADDRAPELDRDRRQGLLPRDLRHGEVDGALPGGVDDGAPFAAVARKDAHLVAAIFAKGSEISDAKMGSGPSVNRELKAWVDQENAQSKPPSQNSEKRRAGNPGRL